MIESSNACDLVSRVSLTLESTPPGLFDVLLCDRTLHRLHYPLPGGVHQALAYH